jgi:DNA-binding beta-propeller fold protein YncE
LFREVLVGDSCPGGWIVVNPANGRVYVAATAVDQVWVFEPDGRLRAILDQDRGFDEPLGLAIAPQAELLYVGNHAGNTIAVMPAP